MHSTSHAHDHDQDRNSAATHVPPPAIPELCWGYNTNGFVHHQFEHVCLLLRSFGYRAVALTVDHGLLNPFARRARTEAWHVRSMLARYGLRCVIETGARYLLDPWRKHWPTLLAATASARRRRMNFLKRAVDLAVFLRADAVSFWSGRDEPSRPAEASWRLLVEGCRELAQYAGDHGVRLAFEPEPGMFVERMDQFERLRDCVGHPCFGLTLDVGHVHCLADGDPAVRVREFADVLFNVHLEDMVQGKHEHLVPGTGEMEFRSILEALAAVGYPYGVYLELSRDSYRAVSAARDAIGYLQRTVRLG